MYSRCQYYYYYNSYYYYDDDSNDSCQRIIYDGVTFEAKDYAKHVGNVIGPCAKKKALEICVQEFNRRLNMLMSYFNHTSSYVLSYLFNSYCMSLYGSCVWTLDGNGCELFYTAWRKAVRRILRLHYRTHGYLLHERLDVMPVHYQLHKRFVQFAWRVTNSENTVLRQCCKLAIAGSRSVLCRNLNYIRSTYHIANLTNVSRNTLLINRIYETVSRTVTGSAFIPFLNQVRICMF